MTINPVNIGGASGEKSAGPDAGSVRATQGMVGVRGGGLRRPLESQPEQQWPLAS